MKQVAFTMKLIPGNEAEYERRHREIWPELASLLREAGIAEYHIFLDQSSHTLFAFQNLKEEKSKPDSLPENAIMRRWWAYMADLMETNEDLSPKVQPLQKVFSL
ncbi:L-rhamnose mutarotase [Cyclobacterium jeungdonense]|uniref:L-rhamnose mutarotase n=1 Tax=Cyclobacterium jeungdonense TaxID=708087 RepID=A0ABT8C324_9BACT|nr:L-rhamnose mutarotase [Cyclobacterium jeungdonense]MDN3687175.1 L-rhamnose mutarotase [Cyclobacterium jeungdonense]